MLQRPPFILLITWKIVVLEEHLVTKILFLLFFLFLKIVSTPLKAIEKTLSIS